MFLQLVSLASWKRFTPNRQLKRYTDAALAPPLQSFAHTHFVSGRMADILRSAAKDGFKHRLQHDCHEALTYILSIAHEEETELLKQQRGDAASCASDQPEYPGVIAKKFGIEERVALTVRAASLPGHCALFVG